MRILRHAGAGDARTAIAIGSFDGVHRGHAAILEHVKREALSRGLVPAVLTFEPLPREFFAPERAPARLASLGERLALLAREGVELAFVERFDARFAALDADAFARRLHRHHGARWVTVGEDFRYGHARAGDAASLAAAGRGLGFEVEVLGAVS